ncbi:MAG: restriction endonuclease, SacI family [Planctomycetaceae bacterium]|nr:restriction endonuclease, SacI family [Planctomycetaceae bacterium]
MAAISVDHKTATSSLQKAWEKIDDVTITPPPKTARLIEEVIDSTNVTFKYILVTGLLGKFTEPKVHPRALQTGSALVHSYDARSLCHKVVVGFEKEKGDLWGLSNEPFVNKPARHLEHDKNNKQLRAKALAAATHDALEIAHQAKSDDVFAMLVHTLRLGKKRADNVVHVVATGEANYGRLLSFLESFLQEADGGARLAAVVGAFVALLNPEDEVHAYPPNSSDTYAKTAGDVEIVFEDQVIAAYECKHRPINLDDVKHGIRKANQSNVSEYVFITAAGIANDDEPAIREFIKLHVEELDVELFDIFDVAPSWAVALNPRRRGVFGQTVSELLRESMHKSDSANKAAELWNELE